MKPEQSRDLASITLAVLAIGGMILASFWIMRPFIIAAIWAAMIVVATWPLLIRAQARLWGRRWLATTLLVALLVVSFMVPLVLAVGALAEHLDDILAFGQSVTSMRMPSLPAWITNLPYVGPRLETGWRELTTASGQAIVSQVLPYVGGALGWVTTKAGSLGMLLLQSLLTLVIVTIMYQHGEAARDGVLRFLERLGGDRGDRALEVAGRAIRGVALGVVVTAVVQSVMTAIGLAVAGIPFVAVLTIAAFVLSVSQIGTLPILLPATIWLWYTGETSWAVALAIWSVFILNIDNFLRPYLIQRGARLPLMLIFVGVIGGLLAFGMLGIFVGPVVLAVTYELLVEWVGDDDEVGGAGGPADSPGAG